MSIKSINKPNFFILGAAKSGTTTLYNTLKKHPSIFLSETKEPTFFCEDFQVIQNPIRYFELFDFASNEKVIGEASHAYMTDPKTPRIINGLFPEAKFLVILRNPADRAFSLYQHQRRVGREKIKSFEKALEKEEKRYHSKNFKKNHPQYFWNFMYFRSGLYGEQLSRYFSLYDKSQFYITTLDKINNDFDNTIINILNFLDVRPNIEVNYSRNNKAYRIRSILLKKIADSKVFKKNSLFRMFNLHEILIKLNSKYPEQIKSTTKNYLMKRYNEDQELLYSLCGIKFE